MTGFLAYDTVSVRTSKMNPSLTLTFMSVEPVEDRKADTVLNWLLLILLWLYIIHSVYTSMFPLCTHTHRLHKHISTYTCKCLNVFIVFVLVVKCIFFIQLFCCSVHFLLWSFIWSYHMLNMKVILSLCSWFDVALLSRWVVSRSPIRFLDSVKPRLLSWPTWRRTVSWAWPTLGWPPPMPSQSLTTWSSRVWLRTTSPSTWAGKTSERLHNSHHLCCFHLFWF